MHSQTNVIALIRSLRREPKKHMNHEGQEEKLKKERVIAAEPPSCSHGLHGKTAFCLYICMVHKAEASELRNPPLFFSDPHNQRTAGC